MKDADQLMMQPSENSQSARQVVFFSVEEIHPKRQS
jgi:uncharacterized protein YdeI (YjbR/CyaY-like superfamily)